MNQHQEELEHLLRVSLPPGTADMAVAALREAVAHLGGGEGVRQLTPEEEEFIRKRLSSEIWSLRSALPIGSADYQSGRHDGLEAAYEVVRQGAPLVLPLRPEGASGPRQAKGVQDAPSA